MRDPSPKLVIDNDAGGDDAMAIFLALLYEKHYNGPKLIGLTTVNGNTNEDNVCLNNQRVLKIIKRQDVPIYRGSKSSLVRTPDAGHYYGKDGLGDSGKYLDGLKPAHTKNAVEALIDLSKEHKDQLTVVTLGALTNVALAIKLDPDFLSRIAHLYVGAGHIHNDSWPKAEFNAHMDVEAYHVVAAHATPDRVTFLPFSQVQQHCNFTVEWRKDVLGAIPTDIMRAQNLFEQVSLASQESWQALDPAAVAAAINPSLVDEFKFSRHDIVTCGEKRGITTNEFLEKENANARIVYSYKTEKYKQFLLDIFKLE
ncbi:inosine-uridine preferring nucleoside hydrolase-like isoform X2 [Aricia agestis]|uniref:inosine-uridine preferring nucleoside hydrolase-like isoform X2 n=1 Tax=Aricia agestis TaxID=91739 RepID=UPI001C207F96|nr:inosine-uridine preferring nucleoside hydrolase-like isoform X2 [Aricia agestis]